MKRRWDKLDESYFGIGIVNSKNSQNIGTLWRSACILGASFIFTVEKRYKKQATDVQKTWAKIPLFHFNTLDQLMESLPYSCQLIGVEMDEASIPLEELTHPARAVYLLGAEDSGLPKEFLNRCHHLVKLPGAHSLNVASAGSIVLYDRAVRFGLKES